MNLFKFASYQGHLFVFNNFCILGHNARIVQKLKKVIRIGAATSDFIEQRDCGSGRNITNKT